MKDPERPRRLEVRRSVPLRPRQALAIVNLAAEFIIAKKRGYYDAWRDRKIAWKRKHVGMF